MASIYTVGQVNNYIKRMFNQDFALNNIYIKGEVSNCKYHTSGHIYFTLKDRTGVISAIMFAGNRSGLKFKMEEGQKVVVLGSVSVYERDGKYQIYAKEIILEGAGLLYQRFEQLKVELEEMGLFDPMYKKPIPRYATRIGICTAQTGAAIQDIINITTRRNPYVQLYLYPCLVQGADAAKDIVNGIRCLDSMNLDTIIVGRGGGSIEDLWAFNERIVAEAIFNCNTPIISAVGHETDTTIADYVSDRRAPTPSAAAELAVPSMLELQYQIQANRKQLKTRMAAILQQKQQQWSEQQKLLSAAAPEKRIAELKKEVQANRHRLQQQMHKLLQEKQFQLQLQQTKLESNHPNRILSKGYAIVRHGQQILSHADAVQAGDVLTIQLAHGTISVQVLAQEEET